jgi:hypothetical protein
MFGDALEQSGCTGGVRIVVNGRTFASWRLSVLWLWSGMVRLLVQTKFSVDQYTTEVYCVH